MLQERVVSTPKPSYFYVCEVACVKFLLQSLYHFSPILFLTLFMTSVKSLWRARGKGFFPCEVCFFLNWERQKRRQISLKVTLQKRAKRI